MNATNTTSADKRLLLLVPVALTVLGLSATAAWWLRTRFDPPAAQGQSDDALRQHGRLIYLTNCAGCHGAEGHGDGPSAAELKPPPRDFAHGAWKFGTAADAVRKIIRDGVPGTPMPASPVFSESDLDALVAHVRSLAPTDLPMSAEVAGLLRQAGFTPADIARSTPLLDLRSLDGRPHSVADLKGKTVLLNFWATTCVHCLEELPELERINEAYRDQGIAVVSVCLDDSNVDHVRKLVEGRVRKLPVFVNPDAKARLYYDVEIMPVIYLIDGTGRLLGSAQGARKWTGQDLALILRACRTLYPESDGLQDPERDGSEHGPRR